MLKFLAGVVVGVLLGVLVIAPDPEWNQRVEELWGDAKVWAASFWSAAEDAADDVADKAGEAAGELKEGANEVAREAEQATQ